MHIKSRKGMTPARAFAAHIMRHLCNYRFSDLCRILGNISQGRVSKLCSVAIEIMNSDENYRHIMTEFMGEYGAKSSQREFFECKEPDLGRETFLS